MAVTVAFEGECDLETQDEVKRKLAAVDGEGDIVIDLTRVSYLDSACITELLLFSRARRERGLPPETILVTSGPVAKVLQVSGVTKLCRVVTRSR